VTPEQLLSDFDKERLASNKNKVIVLVEKWDDWEYGFSLEQFKAYAISQDYYFRDHEDGINLWLMRKITYRMILKKLGELEK
jgi:hypothetical protein